MSDFSTIEAHLREQAKVLGTVVANQLNLKEQVKEQGEDTQLAMVAVRVAIDGNGRPGLKARVSAVEGTVRSLKYVGSIIVVIFTTTVGLWIRRLMNND